MGNVFVKAVNIFYVGSNSAVMRTADMIRPDKRWHDYDAIDVYLESFFIRLSLIEAGFH